VGREGVDFLTGVPLDEDSDGVDLTNSDLPPVRRMAYEGGRSNGFSSKSVVNTPNRDNAHSTTIQMYRIPTHDISVGQTQGDVKVPSGVHCLRPPNASRP
jgi:hypothetical protein